MSKKSEKWFNKTCPICGLMFHVKPSHISLITCCSIRCRNTLNKNSIAYRGSGNPNWKEHTSKPISGRHRAESLYPNTKPCRLCGSSKTERHHIDGNTFNNSTENIDFLCRKHHMEEDGRLSIWLNRNKRRKRNVQEI